MSLPVPAEILKAVKNLLEPKEGGEVEIRSFSPASGGCINNGGKLSTTKGLFFIKWNEKEKYPSMFIREAKGLELLQSKGPIRIPSVIAVEDISSYQFLVLEYIESKPKKKTYWIDLGAGLARLHKVSAETYGLDHENYMGSLPQTNGRDTSWINFFIKKRLMPQIELAERSSLMDERYKVMFERLIKKLPSILPEGEPSLLHGDLWSGNIMSDENGGPVLIDPAVYYGNREADIAMTQLFGGFDREFYTAYQNAFPLQKGFQERLEIYNLYPLLVHVNLFGRSYLHQIDSILRKYG